MKRKLFTGALLTTVVVGAALYGNAQSSSRSVTNAGPVSAPNSQCTQPQPCNPTSGQPCTIADVTYGLSNSDTGFCTTPLFRDGTK